MESLLRPYQVCEGLEVVVDEIEERRILLVDLHKDCAKGFGVGRQHPLEFIELGVAAEVI